MVAHAGFLHDAEKEYAEARLCAAMVLGHPLAGADELGVTERTRGDVTTTVLQTRLQRAIEAAGGFGVPEGER